MKSQGNFNVPGLGDRHENIEWDGSWYDGTFVSGHWYGGHWYFGIWEGGTWHGGYWYEGHWLSGSWKTGSIGIAHSKRNINSLKYFKHHSLISPKCYYKPENSVSLNEARYT